MTRAQAYIIWLFSMFILIGSLMYLSYCLDNAELPEYEEEYTGIIKDTPAVQSAQPAQSNSIPTLQNSENNYTQTLTKSSGVYYYAGRKETYYSSKAGRHYRTSEWHTDCNGFYRTADGYFVVSSSDYQQGAIIDISMGKACVLDTGCAHGVVDIYCNW